jgi:hypothetical protein
MFAIIGLTIHPCKVINAMDHGFLVTLDNGNTLVVHKLFDDSRRNEIATFLVNTTNKINSLMDDVDNL